MERSVRVVVLVAAFLFAARVAMAQSGDAKAGKAVFDKSCVACHAADGSPKEPVAKMLKVEIPHLGSKDVQAKSDADMKKIIVDGYEKMKPVKGLADKDVANVIAFVRTLKQ